ncbi:hypothetical protein X777_00175, partial [Ooceraea biroi]
RELGTNAFSTKLSNGTIPKGLGKEADIRVENISQERKDALERQHSCEEPNLLVSDCFVSSYAIYSQTQTNLYLVYIVG